MESSMTRDAQDGMLGAAGLLSFHALRADAVSAVTERFYETHGSAYQKFGVRGRDACREDLAFHLEFLRPALEFGLLQPMVDYLCWLDSILTAREIPADHLALSLDWLAEFFAMRMDGAEGALVSATLLRARNAFLAARALPLAAPEAPVAWPECAEFQAALVAGRQREALAIFNQCLDNGRGLVEAEMHLIQPALYAIGDQWQANKLSVAQEHMATGIAHAVGLRMVSDAFELAGWDVQYLGANVPTRALVQHALAWKPHLVGLSVSFAQQLRTVKNVIAQMDESFGAVRPAVILGGLAINRFSQLSSMVGADACSADAKSAPLRADQVVAAKSPI
jgi:methanogenic corrinoid protein MtbC1